MRSSAHASKVLPLVSLMLLSCSVAYGQIANVTDDTSTPVPGVGHDYLHMLNDAVSPANGSLSLRIQVPTPKGRGITPPFSFSYDTNGVSHLAYAGNGNTVWTSVNSAGNFNFLNQGGWGFLTPQLAYIMQTS